MTINFCLRAPEEILARYQRWSRVRFADTEKRFSAWCLYVDARDGLADGTTEALEAAQDFDERQLSMFGERRLV